MDVCWMTCTWCCTSGGATCLNRSYPAGYGQVFSDAANLDLEMIEMGAGGVAVPAQFWYEASFQHCQAARPRLLAPEVRGNPNPNPNPSPSPNPSPNPNP